MRVGIVGGGQLGRMLCLAGHDLGLTCITLDPSASSPAAQVGAAIVGAYDDEAALAGLAAAAEVATYEFENVPAASARFLAERIPVRPAPASLQVAQDRASEKALFVETGLDVPAYRTVDDLDELRGAIGAVGLPAMLKARRLGYDGKGQALISDLPSAEEAWRSVGEVPSIVEAHVPFERELSILGARDADGRTVFYPLVRNEHRDGILRVSTAPAPDLPGVLQARAEEHARAVMERLAHVGMLAIELFQVGDHLLANEMAPRVHNSGHWTIEGAATSQFENHLRAVTGLPLGPTTLTAPHAAMVNIIGSEPDLVSLYTAVPGVHVHRYGKQPRPGRKLGHVTVLAADPAILAEDLLQVRSVSPDMSP